MIADFSPEALSALLERVLFQGRRTQVVSEFCECRGIEDWYRSEWVEPLLDALTYVPVEGISLAQLSKYYADFEDSLCLAAIDRWEDKRYYDVRAEVFKRFARQAQIVIDAFFQLQSELELVRDYSNRLNLVAPENTLQQRLTEFAINYGINLAEREAIILPLVNSLVYGESLSTDETFWTGHSQAWFTRMISYKDDAVALAARRHMGAHIVLTVDDLRAHYIFGQFVSIDPLREVPDLTSERFEFLVSAFEQEFSAAIKAIEEMGTDDS